MHCANFIHIILIHPCLPKIKRGKKQGSMLLLLRVIPFLFLTTTMAMAVSLSKPGCPEKCGNVSIPYPFGVGSECSANSSFTIICRNSTAPPTPFLSSIKMEVVNISLLGAVIVNLPVSRLHCSEKRRTGSVPISLKGTPFTMSAEYNSLVVLGCKNSVWLRNNKTTAGGCSALCDADSTDTSCSGVNCCHTQIPQLLQELHYTYQSIEAGNNSFCGYVFPVEMKWLQKRDYKSYNGLIAHLSNPFDPKFRFVPLVLEWEFGLQRNLDAVQCIQPDDYRPSYTQSYDYGYSYGYGYDFCQMFEGRFPYAFCCRNPNDSHCQSFLDTYKSFYYNPYEYVSSIRQCSCRDGYEGNPYLPEGCRDIDECSSETLNICAPDTCINEHGSYACESSGYYWPYEWWHPSIDRRKIIMKAFIIVGSVRGSLMLLTILLFAAWKLCKAITVFVEASRRYMFYKRNGGLLLEQHLSATENGLEKTKLFGSNELERATDHYNENRILGHGGQGTVYKGMLIDGRIVAVKKSKRVEDGDLEVFINEVVILSQINHRNVVRLLGCCLETAVPRLVYEFIPNGTLFQHIHEPNEELSLTWEMRVRIAREVAGALAYLHSASSSPIYHRDIKSTNILLDDKYRAKIADFGTSRSVSVDQTHLTTRVVGTFGYMDPEYFRSSQFTGKSDVYSFGVVMVELLTGEKAISTIRVEEGRGLATHFLHSMDENKLFEILDARVLKEGKVEEIMAMAELAKKCLHLNGKMRPTMKELAHELEAIGVANEGHSVCVMNQEDNIEGSFSDVGESDGFSSTSGSCMHFDTITPHLPEGDDESQSVLLSIPGLVINQ